jgi:hypothetical protein
MRTLAGVGTDVVAHPISNNFFDVGQFDPKSNAKGLFLQ